MSRQPGQPVWPLLNTPLPGLTQVKRNHAFLEHVYQIERDTEVLSGTSVWSKVAQSIHQLTLTEIQQLVESDHIPQFSDITQLYFLVTHFRHIPLSVFQATFSESFLHGQKELLSRFVPVLMLELENFIKTSRLTYHLFSRTWLMNELHQLELMLKIWDIPPSKEHVDKDFFFQKIPAYVALMETSLGSPMTVELWKTFGLLKNWHLDTQDPRQPLPQKSVKKIISNYKLKEFGDALLQELASLEDKHAYREVLERHTQEILKDEPIAMVSRYEKKLRELVQGTLKWGVYQFPSVEPLVREILNLATRHAHLNTKEKHILTLYTISQEVILGTQNIKYRLNDSAKGIANHLADLEQSHPERFDTLAQWSLSAILDSIIEIYESFNLADNTLKSFKAAFNQTQEEIKHQSWVKASPTLSQLLDQPS